MNSNLFVIICLLIIAVAFFMVLIVLPRRKLPEENKQKVLHEERCSAYWKSAGGVLVAGGNIPIARVSFYENFFVVSLMGITKINYSEIISASFKGNWLSKSITFELGDRRSLVGSASNVEKILSIIGAKKPKAVG